MAATTQRTTVRRYNASHEWDTIYLATAADIVELGVAVTLAEDSTPYEFDQVIAANTSVKDILHKVLKRLATYDEITIPGLEDGSAITALNLDNIAISGTLSRDNLDYDISGKAVEVASEAAKNALTSDDVNVGDIVKVTGGKMYMVNAISDQGVITFFELSDAVSAVAWSRISNRPTTLTNDPNDASDVSKFYITNAVLTGDLIDTNSATPASDAGKAVKLNSNGKLGFSITGDAATLEGHAASYFATDSWADGIDAEIGNDSTANTIKGRITAIETWDGQVSSALNLADIIGGVTGATLPISVIPKTALERLYTIPSLETLADSSATGFPSDASNGDTLQVDAAATSHAGEMYYVVDDTKLGTAQYAQGIHVYTAGEASSVEWSNVQNTPTTLSGYGITDAVNSDEKVTSATSANAGKILVLNANGKLDVDITGDAATLGSHAASYFATQSDMTAVETAIGDDSTANTIKGRITALETTVGDSSSGLVKGLADVVDEIGVTPDPAQSIAGSGLKKDIYDLQQGTTIVALAANKLTGTILRTNLPSDVGGKVWPTTGTYASLAAAKTALSAVTTAYNGDVVKLADGKVYMITNASDLSLDAAYTLVVDPSSPSISWSQIPTSTRPTTVTNDSNDASDATKLYLTNVVLTGDLIASSSGSSDAGKVMKLNADGKLGASITGDADTLDGQHGSYYGTAADVAKNEIKLVDSTSEITDAQVGQLCLVTIS